MRDKKENVHLGNKNSLAVKQRSAICERWVRLKTSDCDSIGCHMTIKSYPEWDIAACSLTRVRVFVVQTASAG